LVALTYVICAVVWGTTWFAIRVSIGAGGYPTFESAALRFTVATAALAIVWWLGFARPGPQTRRQVLWLVAAGLLNATGYALVYRAEESVPGAVAAVLFSTIPLFTALMVTVTRTERVSAGQLAGSVLALAGVGLIFSDRLAVSADQAAGIGLILCAVMCSAAYGVIVKREAAPLNPLATVTVFLAVTAAALWILAPLAGPITTPWPPPLEPTLAVVYLGLFGSVLAFASYFYLIKRISLMASTTLVFIQPLIAVVVDALWERDVILAPASYAGMAITLVGVAVTLILRVRRSGRSTGKL
jgi:drug/metabolite transporter (DMT)-like permease